MGNIMKAVSQNTVHYIWMLNLLNAMKMKGFMRMCTSHIRFGKRLEKMGVISM